MRDNDVDRGDDTDNTLRGDAREVEGDPRDGVERDDDEGGRDSKACGGGDQSMALRRAARVVGCSFPVSFLSLALSWFQLLYVKLVHH